MIRNPHDHRFRTAIFRDEEEDKIHTSNHDGSCIMSTSGMFIPFNPSNIRSFLLPSTTSIPSSSVPTSRKDNLRKGKWTVSLKKRKWLYFLVSTNLVYNSLFWCCSIAMLGGGGSLHKQDYWSLQCRHSAPSRGRQLFHFSLCNLFSLRSHSASLFGESTGLWPHAHHQEVHGVAVSRQEGVSPCGSLQLVARVAAPGEKRVEGTRSKVSMQTGTWRTCLHFLRRHLSRRQCMHFSGDFHLPCYNWWLVFVLFLFLCSIFCWWQERAGKLHGPWQWQWRVDQRIWRAPWLPRLQSRAREGDDGVIGDAKSSQQQPPSLMLPSISFANLSAASFHHCHSHSIIFNLDFYLL